MSVRTIKLLHVEDNVADRLLAARFLGTMKEYAFNFVRASTEITAVSELSKGGIDFVILDYRLPLGDGLGCLRKLRELDPAVPIVVISGVVTPEIQAACMQAGADDYLSKQDLTAEKLNGVVRRALSRGETRPMIRSQLVPICKAFLEAFTPEMLQALDIFEKDAKTAEVSHEYLFVLYDSLVNQLSADRPKDAPLVRRQLRPLFLELSERIQQEDAGK
jgi:DNA-binding NarL/FixJ family response regulator